MDFLKVQTSIMDDPRFALADSPARASCQVDGRAHEWNAATEGLSVQTCLAILGWRRLEGDSIRQPSGFTKARAEWRDLSEADRIVVGELVSEATGVALRAKRAA